MHKISVVIRGKDLSHDPLQDSAREDFAFRDLDKVFVDKTLQMTVRANKIEKSSWIVDVMTEEELVVTPRIVRKT